MLDVTHGELLNRAKQLGLPTQHRIGGRAESGDGSSFALVSPRDGQVLALVADAQQADSPRYAADSNLKRVWLELGGKSPHIILPDVPDLEKAAATAAWGIFFNQGEMCTAPSRLLVHSSIAEQVTEAVVARAHALAVGDPLDPATAMGPLVGERQPGRVLERIDEGVGEGARLRVGGGRALPGNDGSYLKPTVLWVNCYEWGDLTVPFGGMKQSGNGRDTSAHALEKYTELKTVWIQL